MTPDTMTRLDMIMLLALITSSTFIDALPMWALNILVGIAFGWLVVVLWRRRSS